MGVVFHRRKTSPIFGKRNSAKNLSGNVPEAFCLSDNYWLQKLTKNIRKPYVLAYEVFCSTIYYYKIKTSTKSSNISIQLP